MPEKQKSDNGDEVSGVLKFLAVAAAGMLLGLGLCGVSALGHGSQGINTLSAIGIGVFLLSALGVAVGVLMLMVVAIVRVFHR